MQAVVYLAIAIVASAAATPVELRPRDYDDFGPSGVVSSSGYQQQTSSSSGSNTQIGPYGTSSSRYSNSQSSFSAYSRTQVFGAFSSINSQLAQLQSLISGGSLSYAEAQQQIQSLAFSFQTAFSQLPQCGCLNPGDDSLLPILRGLFSQFTNVFSWFQSNFSSQFSLLVSPLTSISSQWLQFFQAISQTGLSFSSFLPANFGPVFDNILPGVFPAGNAGVISSSGYQQQSSSSSGSNTQVGPYGASASRYSNDESSFSSHSRTQVFGAFSNINSQLTQIQSLISGGSLSYSVAQQQVQSLAQSFRTAFSQLPQCGCLNPGDDSILPILNGLFSQFTSVMSSFQSSFSSQFSSLASPLASISSQWTQFFQAVQQSGVSFSSFLPANFASVFNNIVPGGFPAGTDSDS